MKKYFNYKFVLFFVLLLIIISGLYFNLAPSANAMCEFPGRYPFWINIPNGRCLYSCYGDLVSCTCNSGYVLNPGCEDPELCMSCVPGGVTPSPDLVAGDPIPTTAPIGIPQTFTSIVSNIGDASTGTTFSSYFQTTNSQSPNKLNVKTYRIPNINILGSNQSVAISQPITFPILTPGTMYIRACADTGISVAYTGDTLAGDVNESNENNNCSSWVPITVGGTTTTMTGTLIPSSSHCIIASDHSSCNVNLSWTINNTEAVPSAITALDMSSITLSTPTIGGSYSGTATDVSVPYNGGGGRTFYLYNNGGVRPALAQVTVTADCPADYSWVNNMCEPNSSLPDLLASDPTPTSATAGQTTDFSATISNVGYTDVPAGVKHVFEFDNDPNHNDGVYYDTTTSTSVIPAGGETVIHLQHTFDPNATNTPYTIYARVCADADERGPSETGATGTVTESLENNNCGANWVTVNVSPTPPANSAACSSVSAPDSVARGNTFSATVVMQNTGTNTWKSVNVDPVNPYRLGSQTPIDNLIWGLSRRELPQNSIASGDSASFVFTAQAPTSPDILPGTCDSLGDGKYSCSFDWGMLKENVAWFGEKCGKKIIVTPSASPGDGACSSPALHYTCATGNATNTASFPTKWTWTCAGPNSSVSCEEKKAPGYKEK